VIQRSSVNPAMPALPPKRPPLRLEALLQEGRQVVAGADQRAQAVGQLTALGRWRQRRDASPARVVQAAAARLQPAAARQAVESRAVQTLPLRGVRPVARRGTR
jgi:hypothetical protein